MKKLLVGLTFLTSLSLLVFGCKTGIDDMLDDYNKNFQEPVQEEIDPNGPYPGDDDFDEKSMLENEYFVYEDGSFILAGPGKCNSYEWIVVDTDDKYRTPVQVVTRPGSSLNGQVLSTYIPDSGLETGKTYKITLTITAGGKTYKDSCGLVIYKHYTY